MTEPQVLKDEDIETTWMRGSSGQAAMVADPDATDTDTDTTDSDTDATDTGGGTDADGTDTDTDTTDS